MEGGDAGAAERHHDQQPRVAGRQASAEMKTPATAGASAVNIREWKRSER